MNKTSLHSSDPRSLVKEALAEVETEDRAVLERADALEQDLRQILELTFGGISGAFDSDDPAGPDGPLTAHSAGGENR